MWNLFTQKNLFEDKSLCGAVTDKGLGTCELFYTQKENTRLLMESTEEQENYGTMRHSLSGQNDYGISQ